MGGHRLSANHMLQKRNERKNNTLHILPFLQHLLDKVPSAGFSLLLSMFLSSLCSCVKIVVFLIFLRSCKGSGTRSQPRVIDLDFPAGIRGGMELRISGQGHAGARGGRSGDLFVKVNVRPHARFTLIQDDLHITVPLTLKQVR